jgi:translocator protein
MTFEIADRTRRRARFRAFASSPNVLALSPQDIARWWHPIQVMAQASTIPAWSRGLGFGVVAIIAVATASAIGQLATCPLVSGPNQTVIQPSSWVFAPVWTTLYVLMAIAVWRILRSPDVCAARRLALTLFFIQLMLKAAWPWMFFGANNPLLGVINIIPQFLVILGHGRRILSAR